MTAKPVIEWNVTHYLEFDKFIFSVFFFSRIHFYLLYFVPLFSCFVFLEMWRDDCTARNFVEHNTTFLQYEFKELAELDIGNWTLCSVCGAFLSL